MVKPGRRKLITLLCTILLFISWFFPAGILAQEKSAEDASIQERAARERGVSLNFDDAVISEVAQIVFGRVLRGNYVIDPAIKGKRITFRTFTPIPRYEVLTVMEHVLRVNGIGYIRENDLYRIVPLEVIPREFLYSQSGKNPDRLIMELLTLKNVDVGSFMADLERVIGISLQEGKVRVIPMSHINGILVISESGEQLDNVRKWTQKLDSIFAGPRPEVFVYQVRNGRAEDIVNMLHNIFFDIKEESIIEEVAVPAAASEAGLPGIVPPAAAKPVKETRAPTTGKGEKRGLVSPDTRIYADEAANSIIIIATPVDYRFIEETIAKVDTVPRQVLIETMVAEVNLSDDYRFGIEWSLKFNQGEYSGDIGFDSQNLGPSSSEGFTFVAADRAGVVRAFLQAAQGESKVNVLASPNILTMDNKEAKIQIGDQVPVATSETNISGTSDIQRTIQYRDTGVILTVKPKINSGGLITLDISQEVSDFAVQNILGSDQVIISTTNASTSLVAHDGQTIIIGGLIRTRNSKSRDYIPILGKIPIIGYLFGYTSVTTSRKELILLMTPHMVSNKFEAGKAKEGFEKKLKDLPPELKRKNPGSEAPDQGNLSPTKKQHDLVYRFNGKETRSRVKLPSGLQKEKKEPPHILDEYESDGIYGEAE